MRAALARAGRPQGRVGARGREGCGLDDARRAGCARPARRTRAGGLEGGLPRPTAVGPPVRHRELRWPSLARRGEPAGRRGGAGDGSGCGGGAARPAAGLRRCIEPAGGPACRAHARGPAPLHAVGAGLRTRTSGRSTPCGGASRESRTADCSRRCLAGVSRATSSRTCRMTTRRWWAPGCWPGAREANRCRRTCPTGCAGWPGPQRRLPTCRASRCIAWAASRMHGRRSSPRPGRPCR